jgi:hypothetical protein
MSWENWLLLVTSDLTESGLTQEYSTKAGPFVRSDFLILVLMMMAVFCHMKPCGLLSSY